MACQECESARKGPRGVHGDYLWLRRNRRHGQECIYFKQWREYASNAATHALLVFIVAGIAAACVGVWMGGVYVKAWIFGKGLGL